MKRLKEIILYDVVNNNSLIDKKLNLKVLEEYTNTYRKHAI
jgi:hypothetical protein